MNKIPAIITLVSVVLLSSVIFAQEEQLNFIPIDSIQIIPTAIKAYDVNDDGIDDLLIGDYNGVYLYDSADEIRI